MSIARLGRKETDRLQRRHLRAHQIAGGRGGRTAAGCGTGRAAGSAVADVANRTQQFQQGRRRLCGVLRMVRIGLGAGCIADRTGRRSVFGQQQGSRIGQSVHAVLLRQYSSGDVSRLCRCAAENHRGDDRGRSQHKMSARRTQDPTLSVAVEGTQQVAPKVVQPSCHSVQLCRFVRIGHRNHLWHNYLRAQSSCGKNGYSVSKMFPLVNM